MEIVDLEKYKDPDIVVKGVKWFGNVAIGKGFFYSEYDKIYTKSGKVISAKVHLTKDHCEKGLCLTEDYVRLNEEFYEKVKKIPNVLGCYKIEGSKCYQCNDFKICDDEIVGKRFVTEKGVITTNIPELLKKGECKRINGVLVCYDGEPKDEEGTGFTYYDKLLFSYVLLKNLNPYFYILNDPIYRLERNFYYIPKKEVIKKFGKLYFIFRFGEKKPDYCIDPYAEYIVERAIVEDDIMWINISRPIITYGGEIYVGKTFYKKRRGIGLRLGIPVSINEDLEIMWCR